MNNSLNGKGNIKMLSDKFNQSSIGRQIEVPFYNAPYTKFLVPDSATLKVNRGIFHFELNEAVKKKLIIITAPAGYGKSTAVSSWILQNQASRSFIWITLDKDDREESNFWHNIIFSINQDENIISYDKLLLLSIEQSINFLINYFSEISSECFIILDDFHYIDCEQINRSFGYFLAYMPKNLHCIVISRSFPSISLSKMTVDEDVTTFDIRDLQFSHEEARTFLNEIMDLKLSDEDIKTLETKTEGWIAALKVAALSLRNCSDKNAFINSFDSSNKKMFQYIFEEVVNFQEAVVREFLLKTSILKNLNKSICDALTGCNKSQEILEMLEANNLFIIGLDERKENYRYDQLLSDILVKLLFKEYPDQVHEIYLAASRWCEDHGYLRDALEYSLGSEDSQNTLLLLEKYFSTKHPDILGPKKICDCFGAIPCEMYNKMPDLCIRYALALAETGQVSLDEKELAERGINLDSDVWGGYKGRVSQLRAYTALKYENIVDVIRYSEQAMNQLPGDISGVTPCLVLGYIYRSLGDIEKAEFYFGNAVLLSKEVSDTRPGEIFEPLILSNFYMASIQYLKGESDNFITLLNQILTENITHKNCMYFCLATAYYDEGDFRQAYPNVMKGLELCSTYEDIFYERVKGFVLLARILFHTGKSAEAISVMNEIDSLMKPDSGNLFILLELPRIVNLLVSLGLMERAEAYIHKFNSIDCKEIRFTICEAQAELSLGKKMYKEAVDILELMISNMNLEVYPKKRIDLLVLRSIAHKAYNENEEALACLREALKTKGAERYARAFIDRGKPMLDLLEKFILQAEKKKDIHLLNIAENLVKRLENKNRPALAVQHSERFEQLSERELEVLRLLAEGLSYEEIGKGLYISLSTVKKHTGNIYHKLQADNKIQAVNIAKANKLVD